MKRIRPSGYKPGAPGDYEVGYGRPPASTRFRTGDVGNPKGRPKRKKAIGQSIEEALMALHKIEENGKSKTLTALDIIIRNLVRTAARGNTRAIQTVFALRERYQDSPQTTLNMTDLEREDRHLIEKYLGQLATAASVQDSAIAVGGQESSESLRPKPKDQEAK